MSMFVRFGSDCKTGLMPLYLKVPSGSTLPEGDRSYDTVIQWGVPAAESDASLVLNPVKCLLRARLPRSVRELWRMNGLRAEEQEERWVHEYLVAVFQQDALGVWVKKRSPALITAVVPGGAQQVRPARGRPEPGMGKPADSVHPRKREEGAKRLFTSAGISPLRSQAEGPSGLLSMDDATWEKYQELAPEEQQSYHVRRAKRDAIRAVYVLGLSTGLVRLGVSRDGTTVVLAADPAPPLTDRLAELYAAAFNQYSDGLKKISAKPVLLGADPEFVLRKPDGGFVSASRFLEKEGQVGHDAVVLSRSRVIHPLAELRPRPCREPGELVGELHRTMRYAAGLIPDTSLQWLAGSMPGKWLPIGGHVHVSGIGLHEPLIRALDNYVALPLVLAEGDAAGNRRPRYGFLGDCRRKRHGGFEYRSLPSWLASPELAYGVLALVQTVALEYRSLKRRPLDSADAQRAYYNGEKKELLPIVKALWPDLEKLPAYKAHQLELDHLRDRLFRLEGWEEQADIRRAWGIHPYSPRKWFSAYSAPIPR